jgi:hypothetical protein
MVKGPTWIPHQWLLKLLVFKLLEILEVVDA